MEFVPSLLNVPSQVVAAAVISVLIEKMKASPSSLFKWINVDTPTVSKMVSAVAAAMTTAGLSYSYSDGTLTVSGIDVFLNFVLNAAMQFLMQKFFFKSFYAKPK